MHLPQLGSAFVFSVFFLGLSIGWGEAPDDSVLKELRSAIEDARKSHHEIRADRIASAKRATRDALLELEEYLKRGGPKIEKGWKVYLNWSELQKQIGSDQPDTQVLGNIANQFYEGHRGLERPKYVKAREALARFVRLLACKDPNVAKQLIDGQFAGLAAALDKMIESPNPVTATLVNDHLNYLVSLEQIPQIASRFRSHFSRPNVYFSISESLVSDALSDSVSETRQVSDVILRTHFRGTATTEGKLSAELHPNANGATVKIGLKGLTRSKTVGIQKPVRIFSTGRTTVNSQALLTFNPVGLSACPATACCVTKSTINGICAIRQGIGSQLIERIAWKQAGKRKSQSERIASCRAEYRVRRSMNSRIQEAVSEGNESLRNKLRFPLEIRNLYPRNIRISSTNEEIAVNASQGRKRQFLASTPPPSMPNCRLTAQIHESMVSNSAINYISGLLLTDELAAKLAEDLLGEIPDSLVIKEDEDPWSITFDRQNPFVVKFTEDQFTIIVRGRRFARADTELTRLMEISATYALSVKEGRLHLVRKAELDVTYPNREGQRLNVADISERNFVRNKFKSLFDNEITSDGIQLPENFSRIGSLDLSYASAQNGWLSLGWN